MAVVATGAAAAVDPRQDATVEVVQRVMPSVVNIATTELRPVRDTFAALLLQTRGQQVVEKYTSIGSGVLIDEEGYLLTNEHVVRRATEIWVKLADGRERQADRVATTWLSDVAVLKVRAREGDTFTPVRVAADDDLLLGETVIAMGNPFGLGGSVSRGILSSKNRRPPPEAEQLGPGDWLQTDAAINPGNSGGPLLNLRGELIGLNVAVYGEGQGIGFAIPIRIVTDTLAELITPEQTKGLWFGAQIKPVVTPGGQTSFRVQSVQNGSPAAGAGLKEGDLVASVNGRVPRTIMELNQALVAEAPSRETALQVRRDDAALLIPVRMIPEKEFFNAELIRKRIGATLVEMTPEMAGPMRLPPEGFYVKSVDDAGPALDAGITSGMIILGLDGVAVPTIVEFAKALYAKPKKDRATLDLLILRRQGGFVVRHTPRVAITLR